MNQINQSDLFKTRGLNLLRRGGRIDQTNYVINWIAIMLGGYAVGGVLGLLLIPLTAVAGDSYSITVVPMLILGVVSFLVMVNNGLKRFRDSHDTSSIPEWVAILVHIMPGVCWIGYVYLLFVPSRIEAGITKEDIAGYCQELMVKGKKLINTKN